jgi:hypothetical protein
LISIANPISVRYSLIYILRLSQPQHTYISIL